MSLLNFSAASFVGKFGNFVCMIAGFHILFPLSFALETQGLSLYFGHVAQFCAQEDNTDRWNI